MKYMVSGMKPVAKKAFNFDAAYEALEASFRRASDAYEKLVSAEAAVEEFGTCLNDCASALESIKKYGVTPQNMTLINNGNQLDKALGMEALDLSAIESLSESTKKLLQTNYCTGLEALSSENVKSFIQSVKDFFMKILEWLKERFYGLSKLVKILENVKIEGDLDPDKQITAIEYDKIKPTLDDAESSITIVTTIADQCTTWADRVTENMDDINKAMDDIRNAKIADLPEKKVDTAANLGYDAAKAEAARKEFLVIAKKAVSELDPAWKKLQTNFRNVGTNNADGIVEKIKVWKESLGYGNKFTSAVTKNLQFIGMSLLAVSKAVKKAEPAPAPAEPAK